MIMQLDPQNNRCLSSCGGVGWRRLSRAAIAVALALLHGCQAAPRVREAGPSAPGAGVSAVPLDPAVESLAVQERLRRVAQEAHGRQSLEEGERRLSRHELLQAIGSFEEALQFLPDRPDAAPERIRARRGLADAYYRRAIIFERAGELDQALAAAILARNHGYVKADSLIRRIRRRLDPFTADG